MTYNTNVCNTVDLSHLKKAYGWLSMVMDGIVDVLL